MVDNQEQDVLKPRSIKPKSDLFEPVLTETKLWAKLKHPKDETEETTNLTEDPTVNIHEFDRLQHQKNHQMMMMSSNDTKKKVVCPVCGKSFSSGKALGGHTRIHVHHDHDQDHQVNRKRSLLKPHQPIKFKKQSPRDVTVIHDPLNRKKKIKTSYSSQVHDKKDHGVFKKPVCVICGKDFPSMKSLFGHMRCHPEREWRGIQPPDEAKVKNSSLSSSNLSKAEPWKVDQMHEGLEAEERMNRAVDLIESLKGWPARAKRCRRSGSAAAASNSEGSRSEAEEEEDDRMREAVDDLMMLSRNTFVKSKADHENCLSKAEADLDIECGQKKREVDQSLVENEEKAGSNEVEKAVMGIGQGESVNNLENNVEKEFDHDQCSYTSDDHHELDKDSGKNDSKACITPAAVIKNRRKRKKLCDLELVVPQKVEASPLPDMASSAHDKYRCNTCDKTFSTHQALGGHRSSHNKSKIVKIENTIDYMPREPKEEPNHGSGPSSNRVEKGSMQKNAASKVQGKTAAVSPGEGSQTCRRVLDFDLNEMPPPDPEDDEEGGGFKSHQLNFSW